MSSTNDTGVVGLVAHDAGGAEIIASYALIYPQYKLILEGPAINILNNRLESCINNKLSDVLSICDWFLCGTSGLSNLEWNVISEAKRQGKKVISFLDHWMNYPERFLRGGVVHLPDEIWVGDDYAELLAKKHFDHSLIKRVTNPYLISIQNNIEEIKKIDSKKDTATVLFVSENISGHSALQSTNPEDLKYSEFDAIEYLIDNISLLGDQVKNVVIRPHPSDPDGKYDYLINQYDSIARISKGRSLLEDVMEFEIIAGCQSMAMVVGLLANKKVVCCIPPGGRICQLPHREIVHLAKI